MPVSWFDWIVTLGLQGDSHPLSLVVDSIFPLDKATEAYERLKANLNVGKIVLTLKATTEAVTEAGTLRCSKAQELISLSHLADVLVVNICSSPGKGGGDLRWCKSQRAPCYA